MEIQTIDPRAAQEILAGGPSAQLIDVRSPAEFEEVHAAQARNIPLERLAPEQFREVKEKSGKIFVICKSGMRGRKACEKLYAWGLENAANVIGGTDAWVKEGLPVARGRKMVSLERQVRMVAGALVLAGALLAYFVSIWFLALPAFVGTGLIFSGITDWCGLALLLARMPWNHKSEKCCLHQPKL
jgi:rhodanese-related sulfurtransferase